tara:strand:- start:880 stop:1233 length:354 start_codon:yes stop_codon:yes gene_type:complete
MKNKKDYITNEHGVVKNPVCEFLIFPKSYKFGMYFELANSLQGLCAGFTFNAPGIGLGSPCVLKGDNTTELDYKLKTIDTVIRHLSNGAHEPWQKNTGPKVIKMLQEYKDQYLQEAA